MLRITMEFSGALVLFLARLLAAQITSVFQREDTVSPASSIGPLTTEWTDSPLSGSQTPKPTPAASPPEEDNQSILEAYLYNGNATLLSLANCSKSYHLTGLRAPPDVLSPFLHPALDALTNAANFLNMIFQANDLRESSIKEDMEWYHALVRGLLESDALIHRAFLTFEAQPTALQPQLVLRASRPSYESQDILLQDLSSAWQEIHQPPPASGANWYTALKFSAQLANSLSKRVLLNDLNTLDTPKWGRGDSYVTNRNGVRWNDTPFLECDSGKFLPGWLLTLSTPFYGLKPDLSPEFRGVIRIDVSLQHFEVDQCAQGKDWFSNTHQCDRTSMYCEPIIGPGFRLGQYHCRCNEGHYSDPPSTRDARARRNSAVNTSGTSGPALPVCLPCWPGCRHCKDGAPCNVQQNWYLRLGVLAIQSFFMLLVIITMLVAYQLRRSKGIRASGLVLLETILFGSLLLYFPVFILYFKPSTFRCILLRWVRLMGFAIVYGTVTLKMYRVLKVFLSRTAQRVPYMSSTHVLKILGIILLTVTWFLTAWTAAALHNRDRNIPLLVNSTTSDGQNFNLCDLDRWDYMMAIAELLFLCWGTSLCNTVKMIPSAFHEPHYMGISVHNELLLSSAFHVIRFVMPRLHPDWMLLLFFTHTHVTITVTLGLLFVPKFLFVPRPLREEIAAEVYEDEVELRHSGFNSSFTSGWNEHNLDSDDVRDELKKLYAQLEVHKTKKMTADNPHLPKKRSSRINLGQSIIRRISKFPESMSRRCSRDERDISLCGSSKPASYKKRGLESSSIRSSEGSFRQCASLLLRKSHSIYDYTQDHQLRTGDFKDSLLVDSSVKKKLTKKPSESSEIKSVDDVPLVYKSVSAHNLTADNQLLQPMPKKLQKSLSVMTSNREDSTLHPSMTYNVDGTQETRVASQIDIHPKLKLAISSQTLNARLSESFDKSEVCPWELGRNSPDTRSQKHVSYATDPLNIQRTPERTQSPAMQKMYPLDTLPRDHPLNSSIWLKDEVLSRDQKREDLNGGAEGSDSDSESTKPQLPVSSSAPDSPINTLQWPKGHRVFSLRGTPCRFGQSIKGFLTSGKGSGKDSSKKERKEIKDERSPNSMTDYIGMLRKDSNKGAHSVLTDELVQQNQENNQENVSPELQEQTFPERGRRQENVQANVGPQRKDRIEKMIKTQESIYEHICPWETVNLEMMKRQMSLRNNICPWEVDEVADSKEIKSVTDDSMPTVFTYTTKSKHQNMSPQKCLQSDICPWDLPETPQQGPQRQKSIWADICPWEVDENSTPTVNSSSIPASSERLKEIKRTHREEIPISICPWEEEDDENSTTSPMTSHRSLPNEIQDKMQTQDKPKTECSKVAVTYSKVSLNENLPAETHVRVEICPWDIVSQQALQRPNSDLADVCPWDVTEQENYTKIQESMCYEVCPWETDEKENSPLKQKAANVEICPWENQEIDSSEITNKGYDFKPSSPLKIVNGTLVQTSVKAEVCPWEVPESVQQATQRIRQSISEICPWDLQDPSSPFESSAEIVKPTEVSAQESANITCPMETEESNQIVTLQDSVHICHSERREDGHLENEDKCKECGAILDASIENCRDTATFSQSSVSEKASLQDSSAVPEEMFSWDTINSKPYLVKQTAVRSASEEVEMSEPTRETNGGPVNNHDHNLNDGKLRNIGSNIIIREQEEDNIRASICPWETELESTTKMPENAPVKRDSIFADICPWETIEITPSKERDTVTNKQAEGVQSNVSSDHRNELCPWETEDESMSKNVENMSTKRDSIFADICPWETMVITPTKEGDTITNKQAEGVQCNVSSDHRNELCPWETEDESMSKNIENMSKKRDSIFADICPWDTTEITPSKENQSSSSSIIPTTGVTRVKEDVHNIDPFPKEKHGVQQDTVTKKQEDTVQLNASPAGHDELCPWETEVESTSENVKNMSKKRDSIFADICPWETKEITPIKENENSFVSVITTVDDTGKVTEDENTLKINLSIKEKDDVVQDVTSNEQAEGVPSNVSPCQDTELCCWETEVEQTSKKLESVSKKQDSIFPDICPWETMEIAREIQNSSASVIEMVVPTITIEDESIQNIDPFIKEKDVQQDTSSNRQEILQSNIPLARRDALCPWEVKEESPALEMSSNVVAWETEEMDDDAECEAEAVCFPPDL